MKQPLNTELVWKEFIDIRHSKNEKSRQTLRKVINKSSRFLDNYYNPGMHEKSWFPNGVKIDKRKYEHAQTGLCHFYEHGNVLYKLDNDSRTKKRVEVKNFLEFEYMQKNEIIITIEHCSNCEDHKTHTQHINDIYRNTAISLQKCILMRFPFIKVYLKPIDTNIVPTNLQNYEKSEVVDYKYKDVRLGAFEIQLAIKTDKLEIFQVHSKLNTGQWPSFNSLLNKVVTKLPRFNLNLSIFDREDKIDEPGRSESSDEKYEEIKSDNEEEILLPSKFENIKINLYQVKNPQILQIINSFNEDLDMILNPKKRLELIASSRLVQKELYGELNQRDYSEIVSTNLSTVRPMTGRSMLSNKIDNVNNHINNGRIKSAATIRPSSVNVLKRNQQKNKNSNDLQRPKSSAKTRVSINPNVSINFNTRSDLPIEDPEIIENLKGTLIRTVYTDREGRYTLDSLPHDTYLIEIENSKNFIGVAQIFKMNFIIENKGDSKVKDPLSYFGTTSKLIGLKRQTDAYVSVYMSFINNLESYDFMPVKECAITLRKITENPTDYILEQENKIIIPDNKKIDGRYDIIIVPGKYIIEVYKVGYDIIRKEIELISGENNINMDLSLEKKYYLNINCINYETGLPLEKAVINVNYSKKDEVSQGLTDKNGIYQILASQNEEFMNVLVNKDGFFSVQRSYVREIDIQSGRYTSDKNSTTGEKFSTDDSGTIIRDMFVYMVREGFVLENNLMLFFSYSNFYQENFIPIVLETSIPDQETKNYVIDHDDRQKSHGIIVTRIRYEKKTTEMNEENQDAYYDEERTEDEFYPEIVRLMFKIQNRDLLKYYEIYYKLFFNGLQRYSCEINIYTPENKFYVTPPQYSRDSCYSYWDIGYIDIKNMLFYEMSLLLPSPVPRLLFFEDWVNFLQFISDNKLLSNLFETFMFNKGILISNDRLLYEAAFIKAFKIVVDNNDFGRDFILYLADIAKNNYKLVSYTMFKKIISSNLRNFKSS